MLGNAAERKDGAPSRKRRGRTTKDGLPPQGAMRRPLRPIIIELVLGMALGLAFGLELGLELDWNLIGT